MRKKISNRYLVVFCMLIGLSFSGCTAIVAGGAGAGATYAYLQGWLERDYEVTLDQAHKASIAAVQSLGMAVVEDFREVGSVKIKAEKGDRTSWINLSSKGQKLTTISVRSGMLGDEAASKTIHREIERRL
jgi:hypothetical protein